MAEAKYIACARCGASVIWRPTRKYCADCSVHIRREKEHRRYESRKDARPTPLLEYRTARRFERNYFTCEHCGQDAYRKLSGSQRTDPLYRNRWCSMRCRVDASVNRVGRELAVTRLIRLLKAELTKKRERERIQVRQSRPCAVCGIACGYAGNGMPRKYCSRTCERKSAPFKTGRRAAKAKRKALERCAAGAVSFDPHAIFCRDGWRCQICGASTPERLAGTHKPRAPELDHRVPLSRGGRHHPDNVQCACRACNQWKGNRNNVGQMPLLSIT